MMIRLAKLFDKTFEKILTILFLLMLFFGGYAVYDTIYIYYNASNVGILAYKPTDDPSTLVDINEDCIGWITIDDTNIDYPLMQGIDNAEYLNKGPDGSYSLSGSIFLDSRNNSDFSDSFSLIYGHHMQGNVMFGCLDEYVDEEYFQNHKDGNITLQNGDQAVLKAFAVADMDANVECVFQIGEKTDVLAFLAKNAMYLEYCGDGHILALSTCQSPSSLRRTVVFYEITDVIKGESSPQEESEND